MLKHFVAADNPAAAVRGRAGCVLIVDTRDAKCHPVSNVCKRCFFWLWQLRRVRHSLDIC